MGNSLVAITGHYDAIVIGIGGMGSAAAFHMARRGLKVLGLERHNIPHALGSSHGITRIIRLCYYEHPSYVPLLRRAYQLWRELELAANEKLLYVTGSIDAGPEGSEVFEGSRKSCELHDLPHEILSQGDLHKRFPGYQLPQQHLAVFQPEGGFLLPERCIVNHVQIAQAFGAEIHAQEQVLDWEPTSRGVRVRTNRSSTYEADHLVIAAGAWVGEQAKFLAPVAVPERQVLGWFQPIEQNLFKPEKFPVFNILVDEGRFYGLPIYGVPGFKLGCYHHLGQKVVPDELGSKCTLADEKLLRTFVEKYLPLAAGPTMSLVPCMFTNTPDEHFILDFHPEYKQVCIASPCSGHGFKFCSVVGEIMADLVQHGSTQHDITLHRLSRFEGTKQNKN